MELWDIYNKDGVFLNKTVKRGQPLAEGEYHLVVGIWVLDAQGKLLVTLRDAAKPAYPNLWENTGGSVLSGEGSVEGALRELAEETGLAAQPHQLKRLSRSIERRAIVDQYRLALEAFSPEIVLQQGETQAAKWIDRKAFEELMASDKVALPVALRWQRVKHLLFNEGEAL